MRYIRHYGFCTCCLNRNATVLELEEVDVYLEGSDQLRLPCDKCMEAIKNAEMGLEFRV